MMLDLSSITEDRLLARGRYATVRGAHEDAKKQLSVQCGQLSGIASQVLRATQPDNDAVPPSVESLIAAARNTLDTIEALTQDIQSLAKQRADLKPIAWPKEKS